MAIKPSIYTALILQEGGLYDGQYVAARFNRFQKTL
jgi:hypothetical protein